MVIPIVVGALGTVSKELGGKKTGEIQKSEEESRPYRL